MSKSNAARIEVINEDKTRVESKNRVRGTAEVDDETKENVAIVIEENEALRKGMHEILDSIHDHDGTFYNYPKIILYSRNYSFSLLFGN